MKRPARAFLLLAAACGAGLLCAELLYRWPAARGLIARALGHGELVAIVDGVGIYASEDEDVATLIVTENLRRVSAGEQVSDDAVERELARLQHQFGSAKVFAAELESAGVSEDALRADIAEHLRARRWLEHHIVAQLVVSEEESRAFYEAHSDRFAQPPRFRASHFFLAAPAATPPEVVQAKDEAIKTIAKRVAKGENFAGLIAQFSEDEATKERGGDLGFFSAARMPEDFIAEVQKLEPGKPGAPVRLPLGFHILQLTDTRPARQMPFEEVHDEIALHLANKKRAAAVEHLRQQMMRTEFTRTPL